MVTWPFLAVELSTFLASGTCDCHSIGRNGRTIIGRIEEDRHTKKKERKESGKIDPFGYRSCLVGSIFDILLYPVFNLAARSFFSGSSSPRVQSPRDVVQSRMSTPSVSGVRSTCQHAPLFLAQQSSARFSYVYLPSRVTVGFPIKKTHRSKQSSENCFLKCVFEGYFFSSFRLMRRKNPKATLDG